MATALDHATLQGMPELVKAFEEIANAPNTRKYETRLMKPARKLRNSIRAAAPDGPAKQGPPGRVPNPAKTIKNSIIAKKFKKKRKDHPAVMVAVHYRIAPHSYLVEYGTAGRRHPKKGEYVWFRRESDGELIRKKSVAPMPANPFFRKTFDNNKSSIIREMKVETLNFIDEAAAEASKKTLK